MSDKNEQALEEFNMLKVAVKGTGDDIELRLEGWINRHHAQTIRQALEQQSVLVESLKRMTFYAALIVSPDSHGTFYPKEARKELKEAQQMLKSTEESNNE